MISKTLLSMLGMLAATLLLSVRVSLAQSSPLVLIAEVAADSLNSATEEFVEIKNAGIAPVDLDGWRIEYMSAGGSSWSSKAELSGFLLPGDNLLAATSSMNIDGGLVLSSGLARSGGHVRLVEIVDDLVTEHDRLGWGTAAQPETTVAPAGIVGQSLKRLYNEDGELLDTNDNSADFLLSNTPSPQPSRYSHHGIEEEEPPVEEPPANEEVEEPEITPVIPPPPSTTGYSSLIINELFIDPAPPLTDKDDEFVELHNPHPFAVNIEGYVVQTGSDFRYSYTLPFFIIEPGEYLAIFSIDSGLTLSNSGGAARLLDPALSPLDESDPYDNSKPGQVWARDNQGNWRWSDTPTPDKPNSFSAESADEEENALSRRQVAALVAATGQGGGGDETTLSSYSEPDGTTSGNFSRATIVMIGVGAVLYLAYEYRHELVYAIRKAGRYLKGWRANRSPS